MRGFPKELIYRKLSYNSILFGRLNVLKFYFNIKKQNIQTLKSVIHSTHFKEYLINQIISGECAHRTIGLVAIDYKSNIGKLTYQAYDAVLNSNTGEITFTIAGYVTKDNEIIKFDTNPMMHPSGCSWISMKLTLNKKQSNHIREYSPIFMKLLYK